MACVELQWRTSLGWTETAVRRGRFLGREYSCYAPVFTRGQSVYCVSCGGWLSRLLLADCLTARSRAISNSERDAMDHTTAWDEMANGVHRA